MYLPEALRCTATLIHGSKSLIEGVMGPDATEKEGSTRTPAKKQE